MDLVFSSDIVNRKQGVAGYWGPSDALHQFCEPHYSFTFYVAEFFNAISSLTYIAAAIYGARRSRGSDRAVLVEWAMLAIIGAGSASFHATMLFKFELGDELPMMGLVFVSSVAKASVHPWLATPVTRRFFNPYQQYASKKNFFCAAVGCAHLATAASYVMYQQYEIFMNGFTALLLLDIAMSFTWGACGRATSRAAIASFALLTVGKLVWEVENRLCASVPSVWPLHVAWHVLSCGGAYYSVRATALRRSECGLDGPADRRRKVE
jgi:dihydroceramidase